MLPHCRHIASQVAVTLQTNVLNSARCLLLCGKMPCAGMAGAWRVSSINEQLLRRGQPPSLFVLVERRSSTHVLAWLVPDISIGPNEPPEYAAMARKAVSVMSLQEVLGRAVVEIVTVWAFSWLVRSIIKRFGDAAQQVWQVSSDLAARSCEVKHWLFDCT